VDRRKEACIADAARERGGVLDGDGGLGAAATGDDLAAAVDLDPADDGSVSRMPPPLRNAPLTTEMPFESIVPVLVTPPLKVVWLITIAVA